MTDPTEVLAAALHEFYGEGPDDTCWHDHDAERILAAMPDHVLAATPDAADGLDVERLALATARIVGWTGALDYHREWAQKVAREYAALSDTAP